MRRCCDHLGAAAPAGRFHFVLQANELIAAFFQALELMKELGPQATAGVVLEARWFHMVLAKASNAEEGLCVLSAMVGHGLPLDGMTCTLLILHGCHTLQEAQIVLQLMRDQNLPVDVNTMNRCVCFVYVCDVYVLCGV